MLSLFPHPGESRTESIPLLWCRGTPPPHSQSFNDARLTPDVEQHSKGKEVLIYGESLQMSRAVQQQNLQCLR